MSYGYPGDLQRIKLLPVMLVPNVTLQSLGVSTVSQHDAALKGHGMRWMMLPRTFGGHIMMPVNATPFSSADMVDSHRDRFPSPDTREAAPISSFFQLPCELSMIEV
jgi:hypothetical protein